MRQASKDRSFLSWTDMEDVYNTITSTEIRAPVTERMVTAFLVELRRRTDNPLLVMPGLLQGYENWDRHVIRQSLEAAIREQGLPEDKEPRTLLGYPVIINPDMSPLEIRFGEYKFIGMTLEGKP